MFAKVTVSAYLIRILEIKMNSKLLRQQTMWDLCNLNSLSRNLVMVVQFNIRPCFRTGARQWNPLTLTPKLALVDIV